MIKKDKKKLCPIIVTHRRLNQSLSIFDDINRSYQNPEKFTSDLNNLIQALRNITFILQSEKSKIENFDEWYEPFQKEMKNDDVMRWLIDSRNHVVKKGDLKKDSYLSIRIVDHYNHEVLTQKFDPFLTTDSAIQLFRKMVKLKYPDILKDEIVLEAERRWVVSSYPKAELVDVLIYCFSILVGIVESAHVKLDRSILDCQQNDFFTKEEDFMVVLRNKLKKIRTTRISYTDGYSYGMDIKKMGKKEIFGDKSQEEITQKVEKRYGDISKLKKIMEPTSEELPFCFLNYHLEMSKRFLLKDGSLMPVCFFYFSKKEPPRMSFFVPDGPISRFSIAESIADIAEETHCRAIIYISEIWVGNIPEKKEDYIPARLQKNKREAVHILAVIPNKIKGIVLPFHRKNKKIILDKETFNDFPIKNYPFFNKLQKVWETSS
ncbi:MAG: hypothetical protein NT094_01420 [Candidatus Staskawiczbacteria bacterium]|nr:hypothetical protein [Candidatus Staskawiczbacteria bacterium]